MTPKPAADSFSWAFDHKELILVLDVLRSHRVSDAVIPECDARLHRTIWLATILSASSLALHRKRAVDFAALLKYAFRDSPSIETACYTIFARAGILPAARHLPLVTDARQEYARGEVGVLGVEFLEAYRSALSVTDHGSGLVFSC
jgi:hypothetical protein